MRQILIGALLLAACDASTDRPARWSYIHAAIIEPACTTASCHSRFTSIAGLDLSTSDSAYNLLTGVVCGEPLQTPDLADNPPRNHVTPGSSDYSQLMYQLRGTTPDGVPYRDVMPPDVRLPEGEIELIARWIDEGAECD